MKAVSYILILVLLLAGGYLLLSERDGLLSGPDSQQSEYADDDDDSVAARQQLVQGSLTVRLSKETQKLAGIETVAAEKIVLNAEEKAFASVIDISQLVKLRSHYRNAEASLEVAQTQFKNAAVTLARLEKLNAETTNISVRELQQARAEWEKQQAMVKAEKIRLDNIRAEMLQHWNMTLTELALADDSALFSQLVNQDEYVLLMSLLPDQQLSADSTFVYVNRFDDRKSARKAYLLSAATYSEMSLGGETYFLHSGADKLRIGMRLHAWLPDTGYSGTGIGIPDEAIVWYAGRAWAYVQTDDETFSRRSLPEPHKTRDGWLVNDNFEIGDRVVVSGAQTLLSEEFKWAIPDEDDD